MHIVRAEGRAMKGRRKKLLAGAAIGTAAEPDGRSLIGMYAPRFRKRRVREVT